MEAVNDVLPPLLGPNVLRRRTDSAWSELRPTLERIIEGRRASHVLEIGAGRHPYFSSSDAQRLGISFVVNDIDDDELAHGPGSFEHAVFDIAREIDPRRVAMGRFDLVFSKMVFEHIKDPRKAWANVYDLLAPGGIGFAFIPTLYSPPFVANRLIPERVTGRMLRKLDPTRNDAEVPKFPAYYRACRARREAVQPLLAGIGFSEIDVVPFFGTPYLPRIPVLKHVARVFDRVVERRDWRAFAAYAYIVARK